MNTSKFILAAFGVTLSNAAVADDVFIANVIMKRDLCVGSTNCLDGETFSNEDIKIKSVTPQILFNDTSSSSQDDWRVGAGSGDFFIKNDSTQNDIIYLDENAPNNAVFVSSSGNLGLGTTLPTENLHITDGSTPTIRLERTLSSSPYSWRILTDNSGIAIRDDTAGTSPFIIQSEAPTSAFYMLASGDVGLGTSTPDAPLEVSTDDSFSFFRITATGATVNESVDITFTAGPLGSGQLRYNIVDGDNQEMSLDADGNMVLDGTLTTAGPTCAGGCDRVFEDGYALPGIKDHAAAMFTSGHLPAVGPTLPGQPINMTEKVANILNELEHAHIYIDQLHSTVENERARSDRMEAQLKAVMSQLDALEVN